MSLEMGAPIDFALSNQVGAGTWHISNFLTAAKQMEFLRPLGDGTEGAMIALAPWVWSG